MGLQGLPYPLSINAVTGDLSTVSDDDLLEDHLLFLLSTLQGEKVMVFEYGVIDPQFSPLIDILSFNATLGLLIEKWIPQIKARVSTEYTDTGDVSITINWGVIPSNSLVNRTEFLWSKKVI